MIALLLSISCKYQAFQWVFQFFINALLCLILQQESLLWNESWLVVVFCSLSTFLWEQLQQWKAHYKINSIIYIFNFKLFKSNSKLNVLKLKIATFCWDSVYSVCVCIYIYCTYVHTFCMLFTEEEGRDLSCLAASLIQVMLDPYFRTIVGFQSLIQKEWVMAGYQFLDRCNHLKRSDKEVKLMVIVCDKSTWSISSWTFVHTEVLSYKYL